MGQKQVDLEEIAHHLMLTLLEIPMKLGSAEYLAGIYHEESLRVPAHTFGISYRYTCDSESAKVENLHNIWLDTFDLCTARRVSLIASLKRNAELLDMDRPRFRIWQHDETRASVAVYGKDFVELLVDFEHNSIWFRMMSYKVLHSRSRMQRESKKQVPVSMALLRLVVQSVPVGQSAADGAASPQIAGVPVFGTVADSATVRSASAEALNLAASAPFELVAEPSVAVSSYQCSLLLAVGVEAALSHQCTPLNCWPIDTEIPLCASQSVVTS